MAIENNREMQSMNTAVKYLRKMEIDGCTISDLIAALESLSNHAESSGTATDAGTTANAGTAADVQPSNSKNLEVRVSELLTELGMPRHVQGFGYVRTAIVLAYENPDIVKSITKELYPGISKLYGATPSRVERAIRHATELAWERADMDVLQKYFGNTISAQKGKPTNSEFIAMLADQLRLQG